MNDILTNKLDMMKGCILNASSVQNTLVWSGQPPIDFAGDLARLQTGYTGARELAIEADSDNSGSADDKADAEDDLEALALTMSAALRNHFKKPAIYRTAHV